jgi:hypothetical protein
MRIYCAKLAAHYEGYGSEPTPAANIRAAMKEIGWSNTGAIWHCAAVYPRVA